jgi:hypothetical protein
MSEFGIKALTQDNIKTPEIRSTYQAPRSPDYVVLVTWSLAAAFGVAFWLFLLSYRVPIIAKIEDITEGALKVKHLNPDHSPSAEATKW